MRFWLCIGNSAKRAGIEEIKSILTTVFAVDAFVAFEQFATQRLCDGKTANQFLAALKRLACQVEERPPKKWIAYTFFAGLLQYVRHQLQASAQKDTLTLDQLCTRTQATLVEDDRPVNQIVAAAQQLHADAVEVIADQNGRNSVCCPCANLNYLDNGWTQGRVTRTSNGYDDHAEGYSASDAKGLVTLHRSAWEMTQGKRCQCQSPPQASEHWSATHD